MSALTASRLEMRECAFLGCANKFSGPPQQRYCDDPRCIEARKLLAQKTRKEKVESRANNLKVARATFPNGTILRIQCAATGPAGRCTNKFTVSYEPQRVVYPKYCELHRNAYQRTRFENAKSKT